MTTLNKSQVSQLRAWDKDINGRYNQKKGITEQFADRPFVVSAFFDIAVSGNIETGGYRDLGVAVPSGALIDDVLLDVTTQMTSTGNSATLDILFASADVVESDGVIVNDYAEASLDVGCLKPTLVPKKTKAETNIALQAGTEKFTAGALRVYVKYFMARD
jgi:hypothetical protein